MKMKRSSINGTDAAFRNHVQNDSDDSGDDDDAHAKRDRRALDVFKSRYGECLQAIEQEPEEEDDHLACAMEVNLNDAELSFLNERKLQLREVPSLQKQCLNCVAYNLPYYTCIDDPFGSLSSEALILLGTYLKSMGLLQSPDVLPLLLTKNLHSLEVILVSGPKLSPVRPAAYWTSGNVYLLFDKIIDKCSGTLKKLHLNLQHRGFLLQISPDKWMPVPSLFQVNKLFWGMGSLTELILHSANIGDTTLSVISTTCTNLTLLDLFDNDGVTDSGLSMLFPSHPSQADDNNADYKETGCLYLKTLGLCETSVTKLGVMLALANFPDLTRIDHLEVNEAIVMYLNKFHKTEVNLECISFVSNNISEKFDPQSLEKLCLSIAHVKSLTIDCGLFDLQMLQHVKYLQNLVIDCNRQIYPSCQLTSLISKNNRLTKLHICGLDSSLDLSSIGFFCPNLEFLYWDNNAKVLEHAEYLLNKQEHFTNLKFLSLDCNRGCEKIPFSILMCMLSSKKLEVAVLKKLFLYNDLLKLLNVHARQEIGGVYSRLYCINVAMSVFDIELFKEIFFIAPCLQQVITSAPFTRNQEVNQLFEEMKFLAQYLEVKFVVE